MYNLRHTFQAANAELAQKPLLARVFFVFWLLGPLIYLIERSPADIWLSLIGLTFLGRSIVTNDWRWTKLFWVQMVGLFWGALFLSALFSPLPAEAASEAAIWVRFPLFAVATLHWLGRNPALLRMLLLSTAMGLTVLGLILLAELYVNFAVWSTPGTQGGRLTWPYGDPVPGNYLAKLGLVVVVALAAIVSGQNKVNSRIAFAAFIALLAMTILTGERINSILVLSSFGLALVWLNLHRIKFLAGIFGLTAIVVSTAISSNDFLRLKFTTNFIDGLFNVANSGYYHLWNTGLEIFKLAPVTGIGAGMFRTLCQEIQFPSDVIARCDNHPHQYYIQIMSESGIVGLFAFVLMVASLIYYIWRNGHGTNDKFRQVCFIVPLALFFPVQATADVFGQWINLMIWYSIALALTCSKVTILNGSGSNTVDRQP